MSLSLKKLTVTFSLVTILHIKSVNIVFYEQRHLPLPAEKAKFVLLTVISSAPVRPYFKAFKAIVRGEGGGGDWGDLTVFAFLRSILENGERACSEGISYCVSLLIIVTKRL